MRYKDRDNVVADLRELANLIEERGLEMPELGYGSYPLVNVYGVYYGDGKDQMIRAAKAVGRVEKKGGSVYYELVRKMTYGSVQLKFQTPRENVCEKKIVGYNKVPKRITIDVPNEFVNEPIVEWDCTEALLKG